MNTSKTWFWRLLNVFLAALVVNLVFFVMPAIQKFGNAQYAVRTISVSAEGKTTVTPDLAQSSFSVISRGKNPEDLADTNNDKVSAVVGFLKAQGLPDADIKTTSYSLTPDYQYDENTRRNYITGYTLTQSVSVKMRDFKKIPSILAGLTPLGVNQIGGISFTVENPETFLGVARAQAIERVKQKAETMARESGARLGRVMNVSESSGGFPISYYDAYGRGGAFETVSKAVSPPTIEPGTEEITNVVTITYELR
jgi:uncharacterized protein